MTVLAGALAVVSFAPSPSVGVVPSTERQTVSGPATHKQLAPKPTSAAYRSALARLTERVEAVETASVTLVGGPLASPPATFDPVFPAAPPEFVESVSNVPPSVLTADSLAPRVRGARQQVAGGDLTVASRVVKGVETDVLRVALDLADQSAQNSALARMLFSTDPHVAVLDAAVGATHAAAANRDVVAAATAAAQARDAAAAITVAAQEASTTADAATKAAILLAEQQAHSTDGYTNGNIPLDVLCAVDFAPGQHLRCDAAAALVRMNAAYHQVFGHDMVITDSYRSLGAQVITKAAKGGLAAVPGTSNHGWGLAVDLGDGLDSYRSPQYAWLAANAVLFGWHHPTYMNEDGRGPHEPWHWEFGTTDDRGTGTSTPILVNGRPNAATPAPVAPTEQPSATPTPTPTPTPSPSPTPTPTPSTTPTPTPTPTPSVSSTPHPTPTPSPDPPTESPTESPTSTPLPDATDPTVPGQTPTP
ncbi:D-alanyl-D-alanine carboxypeptidase family protein [Cellulomonas sp. URHD0024]|uniref:M15 family metallopeptidase n=1 Tax=Cellulomonas sp. URHD0024 TaxID=1302620 RepID=UPI000424E9E6|nr:M15 family metallopeptidase [Cellulomonas sp. URHD0024]